jgi:penicillin amidase
LGALGEPFTALAPGNIFAIRRMGQLVRLLHEQPPDWLARPWLEEIAQALGEAIHRLEAQRGPDVIGWAWGRVRPLTLRHPLGVRWPLNRLLNLGPFPWGGDANTVSQAGSAPVNPADNPFLIASLRMVVDVGAWDESQFVLPGGQSGTPLSPHYADQLPLWQRGEGIPIPWSAEAVAAATRHTLRLVPVGLQTASRPTRRLRRWAAPVVAVTAAAALLAWRAWTRRSSRRD